MAKHTLEAIVNAGPGIDKMMGGPGPNDDGTQVGWPLKTLYVLARLAQALAPHRDAVEKARMNYVKANGKPVLDDDGEPTDSMALDKDDFPAFLEMMTEILSEEVKVDVPLVTLPDAMSGALTPGEMIGLLPFVTVENNPDE